MDGVSRETRIVLYLRVSTDEQVASGLGLEAQRNDLERAADYYRWHVVETIRDEGASGKDLDRPGLHRALDLIARGEADGLAVAKLDRLSRSVVDFAEILLWLEDTRASLIALDMRIDTSTASGRMCSTVLMAVAQWERDTIADRTRAGLAALRAQGKPTGRPAVADRPELAARIRALRDEGLTLQRIADLLNAEGVPTARGAAGWRPSSVQSAAGYRRRRPRRKHPALPDVRA
jgi:DNA invertase Pin-like site-specific DNA recombinase